MILRLHVSMAVWHMLVIVLSSLLPFGHCDAANVHDAGSRANLNARADRASFESLVSTWKKDNPHLANTIANQDIENIWLQVSGQFKSKEDPSSAKPHNLPHDDTPRLASSSPDDVSNARRTVRDAIRQASSFSKEHTKIHRNSYKLKPDDQTQARAKASSFTPSTQQKHAAALVAEADARDRKANGTLHRQYKIPEFNNDGKMPSFYTYQDTSDLSKRDASDYWLATVGAVYPGNFPYGGKQNDNYTVFRNVKDYGAKGDGATDDTFALLIAIYAGNRCGKGCGGSTVKGATVYVPPGTYLVSAPIVALYNTQLVGHPKQLPVIRAAASFTGLGVFTSDVYIDQGNGETWYLNTANFLRQIRNFVIDTQDVEVDDLKVLHWQVAQATSLQNIHINMKPGSSQIGLFIENGSGGTLDSISISGGAIGINCGNQQFTSKNIVISGSNAAISMLWDWGWTWQALFVTGCDYGIKFQTSDFVGGSLIVLDSLFYSVKNGIYIDQKKDSLSLSVKNIQYGGVGTLIQSKTDGAVLAGGSGRIDNWLLGTSYHAPDYKKENINGKYSESAAVPNMPGHQTASGAFFIRTKPQYEDILADKILHFGKDSAKTFSNGQEDATSALSLYIASSAHYNMPFYLTAGSYIVTDTLKVPSGAIIIGSCWSQLIASGEKFSDMNNPKVLVQVGEPGSIGSVEISDILFTVKGSTAGAVLVEWNLSAAQQGSAAMWDSHFRVGGAAGSDLQKGQCPKLSGSVNKKCIAASLLLHLTPKSNAYLDNIWAWTADHDLDDPPKSETQIDVYSARGILIESRQATWLYGTSSEHNVLYQYSLSRAANVYMAMIQTESPYYLPHPPAPAPFETAIGKFSNDPDFKDCKDDSCKVSWALYLTDSSQIFIAGAGLYSWFYGNYDRSCVANQSCQQRLVRVDNKSNIIIYSLYTVGAKEMVSQGGLPSVPAKDNLKIDQDPFVSIIATYNRQRSNFLGVGGVFFEGGPPDHTFGDCKTTSKGAVGLIDWWLKEKLHSDEDVGYNWETRMFMLFGGNNNSIHYCNSLARNVCKPKVPCNDKDAATKPNYANAYWAANLLACYFLDTKSQKDFILEQIFIHQSSMAIEVAADFPVDDPEPNDGFSKALQAFGKVVGLGQLGLKHSEETKSVGDYLGELGTVVSAVDGFLSSPHNETKPDIENLINLAMDSMKQLIVSTTDFAMTHYFGLSPRLDDWPESIFPKNTGYISKAAQFLGDGRYSLHGAPDIPENHVDAIQHWLNSTAVTVALAAEKYYIIVDFYSKAACNPDGVHDNAAYRSARWIDGHCYALHKPGPGYKGLTVTDPGVYTEEVSKDRLKLLDKWNIDLDLVYKSSRNCQARGNTYNGNVTQDDFNDALAFEKNPEEISCIYSLPVIYIPANAAGAPGKSPCRMINGSKEDKGSKAGYTYLPARLQKTFAENEFCFDHCIGKNCTCNQQPNCAGTEDLAKRGPMRIDRFYGEK